MPASSSLTGLIKWLGRDQWREPFEEVLWLHLGPACEQAGLDLEDMEDILGHLGFMTLWGCAFEDFLTRTLEPDERNIVDDYLKRRGWKESVSNKRYMQALRGSVMSLYEVSGIVPGESFLARDLVRGGEPVRVSERTATQSFVQWERIGARIVEVGGTPILGGGLLSFTHETSEEVLRVLKSAMKRARRELGKLTKDAGVPSDDQRVDPEDADRLVLQGAAPVFSSLWLADALPRVMDPSVPTVVNSDGDEITFHTVRYAFRPGTTADAVRERLRTVEVFREESETFWNWIEANTGPAKAPSLGQGARPLPGKAQTYSVTLDDGTRVLGNLELADGAVLLAANSRVRAERGQALLTPLLGELVRTPLTEIQAVEQLVASSSDHPSEAADEIPADVRASIVHETLDRHYHAVLDQPIDMLGGKTPRACTKTRVGREKVAGWLKLLESQSSHRRDPDDPMGSYDFGWMWTELGIPDLRR
jgi:hypothetical protein